ncbi:hypothetical protein HDE_09623 [Halotydeus destructor]|nr:hypothetical protein HDE_09623 [Halotydeus destructor]
MSINLRINFNVLRGLRSRSIRRLGRSLRKLKTPQFVVEENVSSLPKDDAKKNMAANFVDQIDELQSVSDTSLVAECSEINKVVVSKMTARDCSQNSMAQSIVSSSSENQKSKRNENCDPVIAEYKLVLDKKKSSAMSPLRNLTNDKRFKQAPSLNSPVKTESKQQLTIENSLAEHNNEVTNAPSKLSISPKIANKSTIPLTHDESSSSSDDEKLLTASSSKLPSLISASSNLSTFLATKRKEREADELDGYDDDEGFVVKSKKKRVKHLDSDEDDVDFSYLFNGYECDEEDKLSDDHEEILEDPADLFDSSTESEPETEDDIPMIDRPYITCEYLDDEAIEDNNPEESNKSGEDSDSEGDECSESESDSEVDNSMRSKSSLNQTSAKDESSDDDDNIQPKRISNKMRLKDFEDVEAEEHNNLKELYGGWEGTGSEYSDENDLENILQIE